MQSSFVTRWHLDLAAWGVAVGLIGAILSAALARWFGRRATAAESTWLASPGRVVASEWLAGGAFGALQTAALATIWVLAATIGHLVEVRWLLSALVAAAGAALDRALHPVVADPDPRRDEHRWARPDQLVSTTAMIATWGVWAAVPDTEVAVVAAAAVTTWWALELGASLKTGAYHQPIGCIAAAALSVALPAAMIGRGGGTSWIGGLGCGAPVLGLWLGSGLRAPSRARSGSDGPSIGSSPNPPRPSEVATRSPFASAAIALTTVTAMVVVSSRTLSQLAPLPAASGVAGCFALGLATGAWITRGASALAGSELTGSGNG